MQLRPGSVGQHMTRDVVAIHAHESLLAAHDLMRSYRVRHLPVIDRGELVGIISLRDLILVEGLPGVDQRRVTVADAMTHHPYVVSPEADLGEVVRELSARRLGSAIVVEKGAVAGIFTTVDALRAFSRFLDERRTEPAHVR